MKKRKKQLLALLLAGAMVASGCGSSSSGTTESSSADTSASESAVEEASVAETETESEAILVGSAFADEDKPTLKILMIYQSYVYEEQPAYELVQELSGYNIELYMLPAENAEEKVLLEVASGADYDILMRMTTNVFSQLAEQGALLSLDDLLEEYGQVFLDTVSDLAWNAVTDDNGNIVGIPMENATATTDDFYGAISQGIGVRTDVMEELGLEIPTTLDEFTEFLRTIRDELGIIPYTTNTAFDTVIMTAFDLGSPSWYDIDGTYTYRVKHPRIAEYLEYLQMLYAEGLMDPDMPINTSSNIQEKIASGAAASKTAFYFYDTTVIDAIAASNPDCSVDFITFLAEDEDDTPVIWLSQGISAVTCITKNCENPEYAIDFLNTISQYDNYKHIYIGEEGVSYEVTENGYYPIFSGDEWDFSAYTNSDKFTMISYPGDSYSMWMCRARKTDVMADLFDGLNSDEILSRYTAQYRIDSYGTTSAEVTEYYTQLTSDFSDAFKNAIVNGTDPEEAIAEMQANWDANGGLIVEAAMQEFYDANKDLVE